MALKLQSIEFGGFVTCTRTEQVHTANLMSSDLSSTVLNIRIAYRSTKNNEIHVPEQWQEFTLAVHLVIDSLSSSATDSFEKQQSDTVYSSGSPAQ